MQIKCQNAVKKTSQKISYVQDKIRENQRVKK